LEAEMKRVLLIAASLLLAAVSAFSQTVNEQEPNGCITLVDGNDPYQTVYPGTGVYGSVSSSDTEGCLYFGLPGGDEYIEDLYALSIGQPGYYAVNLLFYGYVDLDLYLMDMGLNILNPGECGNFTCGITCGNPEVFSVYLEPGTYLIGVSLATVSYCFNPGPTDYFLSVNASSNGERPVVTDIKKAGNPFRLLLFGRNFYSGMRVVINGNEWTNFTLDGTSMIKLKKGSALKAMFPKDGSWVPITVISGTDQAMTVLYNRFYNLWQEGGR